MGGQILVANNRKIENLMSCLLFYYRLAVHVIARCSKRVERITVDGRSVHTLRPSTAEPGRERATLSVVRFLSLIVSLMLLGLDLPVVRSSAV
jgi:hypothetical protein